MIRDVAESAPRRLIGRARRHSIPFVILSVEREVKAHLVAELASVRVAVDEDGKAMAQGMKE
jgi:hypothetical protein